MKILFLTLEYPPQKGGVASYYFGMVEELKRQGYEVDVIFNDGAHWNNPSQPPLTLRGGNLLGWMWPRWLKGYYIVRRALKKQKYDVLFVGHLLPLGTVAYLLRRKIPYVIFTHGMDVLMAQNSWRKKWIARKVFEHAKLIVANSEFTKGVVEEIGVAPERVRRRELSLAIPQTAVVYPCPNMVSDVKLEQVEVLRRKLGLVGKKVLLTLGRVVPRKGHDLVLRALPEILEHVPETVYVIAGVGADLGRLQGLVNGAGVASESPGSAEDPRYNRDSRRRTLSGATPYIAQGLQSAVRFVGAISDEERAAYFALCDLFVMPSRQIGPDVEGFGIVYLEAAIFGKPSIGGQSGGIAEAILDGKTGALVDPADPSAFARVTVQLLRDDAQCYELGQNAKARVLHEFRWEKQVQELLRALE
ncbi:MAG: glycosyltransferase family 4 protein [bacterium]|nr:glycosyltransferase family 4 protein [bacterium]